MLALLTKKANELLDRLEADGHLLSDAEYRAAVGLLDDVIEELAVAEIEEAHEAEDSAERRRLPAGSVTRKSLTATPPEHPRYQKRDGRWFMVCDETGCRPVTDDWTLRWLRDQIPGRLVRE